MKKTAVDYKKTFCKPTKNACNLYQKMNCNL